MKTLALTLLSIGILVSCSKKDASSFDAGEAMHVLEESLSGKWQLQPDAGNFENWAVGELGLTGTTIAVQDTDTLLTEALSMELVNDTVKYTIIQLTTGIPTPIEYELTEHSGNAFVFENPEREFPKKITMKFNGKRNNILLEGDLGGQFKQYDILYKKVGE